jgi:selenocysteine lyase/cysteine desulfurase
MSPLLQSVHDAGLDGLTRKSFPHEVTPVDFFTGVEALQKEFTKLINAEHHHRIAILPSASYGIANAARNIPIEANDNIIIVDEQFPSNYYVWEKITKEKGAEIFTVKPPTSTENRGKIWNQRILSSINANTKVVAISHVHWADGTKFDLKAIRKRTKEVGAYLIVDGSQSVGALPFDVQEIQPDALICVGYKWLMGPYSIGLAYYGEAFDDGQPIEESWLNRMGSENFANLVNYEPNYKPMAQRFNVGQTGNFINIPMMTEAIRQLNEWKVERINEYCNALIQKPLRIFHKLGCSIESLDYSSPHLIGVRVSKHMNLNSLKNSLEENRIKVSVRGNSIRISTNVYNDRQDFERLIECFEKNSK